MWKFTSTNLICTSLIVVCTGMFDKVASLRDKPKNRGANTTPYGIQIHVQVVNSVSKQHQNNINPNQLVYLGMLS